jgi:hypothetical protein
MKTLKAIVCGALAIVFVNAALGAEGVETKKPAKPYPLKTCLVTGEALGGMGESYVFTYKGQEIKLCCKGCLKAFNKEPAKYIKKLAEAEKADKAKK